MAGVCWRCQMLYQHVLFWLLIFLPTQVCLLFLSFLLSSFTFPACQRIFFSPLYDCHTPKRYWRCFKCNSEHQAHYFHVHTDVMCTHHSEGKISFLFGLYLAIVPLLQLKAFRLTIILCFLLLLQWHSDVIRLWGMSKEVLFLWVSRVFQYHFRSFWSDFWPANDNFLCKIIPFTSQSHHHKGKLLTFLLLSFLSILGLDSRHTNKPRSHVMIRKGHVVSLPG